MQLQWMNSYRIFFYKLQTFLKVSSVPLIESWILSKNFNKVVLFIFFGGGRFFPRHRNVISIVKFTGYNLLANPSFVFAIVLWS